MSGQFCELDFSARRCVPCEGGVPKIFGEEAKKFLSALIGWEIKDDKELYKRFKFKNFPEAVGFVNRILPVAEEEGHHPDIYIFYNKVDIKLSTHAIGGLSENDFIMAAKIDKVFKINV